VTKLRGPISLVIGLLTTLTLAGCGPEQSASDRDQEQADSQYMANKTLYDPFVGTFSGTVTYADGRTSEVALNLVGSDNLVSNPGRLENTKIPTLSGTLSFCLKAKCFSSDVHDNSYADTSLVLNLGNYNRVTRLMTFNATQNTTACTGAASANCSPYSIDMQWGSSDHSTLIGALKKAGAPDETMTLTRR